MEKLGDKKKYYKKIITFIIIIAMFFTLLSFAVSNVQPRIIEENGVQYIFFEIEHNLTNAAYKYFGYGYHVTIYDNTGKEIGYKFITNADFSPQMVGSTETVKIPVEKIFEKVNVENKYYYRQGTTIWLNGRLGIKVNGTLKFLYDSLEGTPEKGLDGLQTGYATYDGQTVPLNKDEKGIRNGITHEYGISWSLTTQINLQQHFGINLSVKPIFKYDGFEVLYKEVATGKTVSSQKPIQNLNQEKTITEYPQTVNGYEYSGYYEIKKVDKIGNTTNLKPIMQGDSATVSLAQTSSVYTIIFYYNKVDSSSIGKPVYTDVEYRENTSYGKILNKGTTILGGELSQFNLSSLKIDGYTCKGYYVIGQSTEYFYNTSASFIIGKENYSKPINGRLKIIFIYEEDEIIEIPKCDLAITGDADTVNINMKKSEFEKAIDISVNNAVFKIEDFQSGKDKNGNIVEGTHEFKYFDLYVDDYISSYDNRTKEITQNFIVPKSIFSQSPTDPNLYTASVKVLYAAFCSCFDGKPDSNGNYGMATDKGYININITLIENKPPEALYTYYTPKIILNGSIEKIKKAYIGQEVIIENMANDPNGNNDIRGIIYNLEDSNKNKYYINLLMVGNEVYFLDNDNLIANNIIFNGITDKGNLKLKFLTEETWTISQYVEDMDGLNDTYTGIITAEILDLRPIAVINDATGYRYPIGVLFNGKQNRVVKYFSSNSYVADFLCGTGVTINHNRDCWEIIPMDGQNIDNIYFENKTGLHFIETEEDKINIKYSTLNNTKLQFKDAGRYKIRLQVSDINGNVSTWTEEIITINEDLKPQVIASINASYVRNTSGIATISIKNITPKSVDGDNVIMDGGNKIKYRYDSDNDGSFEDELLYDLILINNGSLYETTLTTSNLGKYQFIINVSETFGQDYLEEFITDDDYKKAGATLQTHIDNIEPDVTNFKIMTTEN